jgi:hypothetical protein
MLDKFHAGHHAASSCPTPLSDSFYFSEPKTRGGGSTRDGEPSDAITVQLGGDRLEHGVVRRSEIHLAA